MVRGEGMFLRMTSLAPHVIRSAPIAAIYAGLTFTFTGGTLGLVGVYIVFTVGIVEWILPDLYKWEWIITLAGLAITSIIHAVASLWVHPILAVSVFLAAGNMLLNTPDRNKPYEEVGRKYWPESVLLVPVGLVGKLALAPVLIVIIPTSIISWIRNFGDSIKQTESDKSGEDPTTVNQSTPQQELETVQQSGRTVEDINTRRPNEKDP